MRRCLVVATRTLGGERLYEEVRRRIRAGPCRFHVVVPAPVADAEARVVAERRLDAVVSRLHGMGILATGEVRDGEPDIAVAEVTMQDHFDEVILGPLPV
jgi:hypothetical protein